MASLNRSFNIFHLSLQLSITSADDVSTPETLLLSKSSIVASKMSLMSGSLHDASRNALGRPSVSETALTTCLIPSTMAMIEEMIPTAAINSAPDIVGLRAEAIRKWTVENLDQHLNIASFPPSTYKSSPDDAVTQLVTVALSTTELERPSGS